MRAARRLAFEVNGPLAGPHQAVHLRQQSNAVITYAVISVVGLRGASIGVLLEPV